MAGGGGDGGGGGGGRKSSRLRRARSAGDARADTVSSPPRRRSERNVLSSSQSTFNQGKQCLAAAKMVGTPKPAPFKARPITLKKIVPRNRQITESAVAPRRSPRNASCKENKENLPAIAAKVKSPDKDEGTAEFKLPSLPGSPNPQPGVLQAAAGVLSAVNTNVPESSLADERDRDMAKRVRRSYSRLEISLSQSFLEKEEPRCLGLLDASTPSHALSKRQTLFGFEKLLVPDGLGSMSPVNTGAPQKAGTAAAAAAAGEPEAISEIDPDIPGISFVKEKRRKKKMPQFANSELDQWAAQMNAEFEEVEKFDLLVE